MSRTTTIMDAAAMPAIAGPVVLEAPSPGSATGCPVLKLVHALDATLAVAPRGALLVGHLVGWFEEAAAREVATSAVGLLFQLVVARRIAWRTLDYVPDRDEKNPSNAVDRAHMVPDLSSSMIKTFAAQGVALPLNVSSYYGLDGGCDHSEIFDTTH